MDAECLNMRNCLERITKGRVFLEEYSDEDEAGSVILFSLYTRWLSPDMQGIVRKHINAYVFRESLLNKNDIMFVATDEKGNRFYNTFPSWLSSCEFDFIEREKLEQYREMTE